MAAKVDTDRNSHSKVPLALKPVMESTPNQKELEALQKFRNNIGDVLQEKHDDRYLLRWLRARNCDVEKAEKMLRASLEWRKKFNVDSILENYVPPEFFKKYMPVRVCEKTKDGHQTLIYTPGYYDVKGLVQSCKKMDIVMWIVYAVEKSLQHGAQTKQYVILDMDRFSLRLFMWKPVFDMVREGLLIYDANYPELLNKAIVINAPTIFSVAYALLKPFLHERTASKVAIYGTDEYSEALLKDIDADQLLQCYGGNKPDDSTDDPDWSCSIFTEKPIPISYYKKLHPFDEKDLTVVTINTMSHLKIEVDIDQAGAILRWKFQTESNDIGFGIALKTKNGCEEIIPVERVNCHIVPDDGEIVCTKIGTYEVCFDNSFSYLRSKKLTYKIEKVNGKSTANQEIIYEQ